MQKQKTERIDIRTSATARAVLQQAASSMNKTVSSCLLLSASLLVIVCCSLTCFACASCGLSANAIMSYVVAHAASASL